MNGARWARWSTWRAGGGGLSPPFSRPIHPCKGGSLTSPPSSSGGAWGTLVDVAGGVGSTLAAILQANPRMQGVLFDLPHVIERGREHLATQGVAARCRTEAGSFFDAVPSGADAYFMKHILHDWDDDDCLRIL